MAYVNDRLSDRVFRQTTNSSFIDATRDFLKKSTFDHLVNLRKKYGLPPADTPPADDDLLIFDEGRFSLSGLPGLPLF
jgi:hypothetical protein